jgi:uncharacterized protein
VPSWPPKIHDRSETGDRASKKTPRRGTTRAQSRCRAILLAGAIAIAPSSGGHADCQGQDLFPKVEAAAPLAFAAIEQDSRAMPFGHGKLFRLSHEGTTPSYVFGTLHLSDPRIADFSPRPRAALANSKIVALEATNTGDTLARAIPTNRAAMRGALLARGEQRPDRLLSKADFAELEAVIVRHGLRKSTARNFKPSVLALILDQPACAGRGRGRKPGLDAVIDALARENMIPVVGLETIIEQVTILDGLSRDTERDLLIATLRQADNLEDIAETTIVRYQQGDIGGLLAWMRSPELVPDVAQARIPPDFFDRLITVRNRRMRDRALPLLRQGGAFIAVGAAHLPGKEGLLRLLEEDGYHIEMIE